MLCPIDKKNLDKSIFYGVEVDYCPQCLGVWFEQDELRLAKDNKDENLKWFDIDLWHDWKHFNISHGERMCPSCRLPLYEVYYGGSGVIVDVCNVCYGIWLDRGEFKKMISYLRKELNYEVLNNYMKNLLKEGFEIFTGPESFKEEVEDFLTVLKILNYKFVTQHPHLTKLISSLPR
ncbi:hypothetical protein GW888_00075 [Candidatus Wolfebacteria bacterium]|uniref:Transcription factor zinc-finger domain-containing protein n=1 Tax=Candidatus Wolfebacteria bacterium CG1_02_39_135 TaxID=1805425 RepID=A0A1J4Y083_9BACT|nr:hypothetical protein [Candidatus Wolfebacteria bacterium]OIO64622.1 MAG: hypothetical protein AUJ30_02175 [Candidatus Wolfebacteria bacterium CG1_02_39_135]